MKKLLLALAIGTASLVGFSSCTKEYVTNNFLPGVSYYKPVSNKDWKKTSENTFEVVLSLPQLEDFIYDDGAVDVAIQFEDKKGIFYNIPAEDPDNRGHGYNASYEIGKVHLKAFDLFGENAAPDDMRVKITLTEGDIGN
ncbi:MULTISPECIES: hypothetical protein [Sphingobacterium]|uniref:DUF1735 domain-containing protein n=1 Tax=Sphingobacterium cellulitidis TaxID=1768011 RepID=A0A8H9G3B2_9SPHI|nr:MULTISPECIES: hypothetical protein [Sphingobacterium]MBA8987859.1 hypothetical protein [Sphingobacterium soli]WFB64525.1 hypothetical protein PZ892_04765 [Sphingobacterium sp. WM]GGE23578.1 hypothetical protein GCM10011516_21560 [Sphingobacterium soli]